MLVAALWRQKEREMEKRGNHEKAEVRDTHAQPTV